MKLDLQWPPFERCLSPKEVAGYFGLKEDSAFRWIREGIIPREFIRFCGRHRMMLHPEVIAFLEKDFEAAHDR